MWGGMGIEQLMAQAREAAAGAQLAAAAAAATAAARTGARVPVPDNREFVKAFDPEVFVDRVVRPTKVVIMSQDPEPGDFIPAGSPVTVTTMVKDFIPIDSFKGISGAVVDKFVDVGTLVEKVEDSPARDVLAKDLSYAQLSSGDKQAVDGFISQAVGVANAADAVKSELFDNLKFLYGF